MPAERTLVLPVLGVPIAFRTDSPALAATVEAAFGRWRGVEPHLVSAAGVRPTLWLRAVSGVAGAAGVSDDAAAPAADAAPVPPAGTRVSDDAAAPAADAAPVPPSATVDYAALSAAYSVRLASPHRIEVTGPGVHGVADAAALTGPCDVAPAALHDRQRFEETVLHSLVLFLIGRLDRQPLHAGAIVHDGCGVLLCGPSGAGKSTLAYAALRAGWDVVSDDVVYVQSQPVPRVWARPARLHLQPAAAAWFPELASVPTVQRDNGRWKLPIDSPRAADVPAPLERPLVCLLERTDGSPGARSLGASETVACLLGSLDAGFDLFRATIEPALSALLADTAAWQVRTGSDPRATVRLLGELVSGVTARA